MSAPDAPTAEGARGIPDSAYRRMTLVLRVGLLGSLAILAAAVIAYPFGYPSATSGQVIAANPIAEYLGLSGLLSGLATGSVPAYLTLGLLVLIGTPIARVASGFYYFRRGGEREMAAVTLTVLVLLLLGLVVFGPFVR